MATITWSLAADFDRDGTYETDLTGYVDTPGSGFQISRGIGRDGKPNASKLTFALRNSGGEFTPENTASTFYGKLEPGVPVRVQANHSATDYTIITAYAMRWKTAWAAGQVSMCQVDCEDIFAVLRDADTVNVVASDSRDTDAALVAIMDALGLVAGDRNFDDGVQDLPMHFAVGQNPLEAMMQIAASEMGGQLYPDATGRIRFEARNSRLGTTVDDTWGDGTTIIPVSAGYDLNPLELVTKVTARGTVFRTGVADTEVFAFSENMFTKPTATSMALAAGEVWERTFQAKSAYVALTALDSGYDYTANDAANGTGTDRTANLTATVTDLGGGKFRLRLENTYSGTIYVTSFRLRGEPVEFYADRSEASFSLSQSGLKAGRNLEFDVPFAGDTGTTLRDYAYQELRVGRYPWPTLTLAFKPKNDTARASLLAVELGDLIRYTDIALDADKAPNVDDWWYVEGLSYTIPPGWAGQTFDILVTLIPSYVYRNLAAIVFDTFDRDDAAGDLGTSFSGDAWADDSGWDIVSNKARPNTAFPSPAHLNVGSADMVVEISLANLSADTNEQCGVVFRLADTSNYLYAIVDDGNNIVQLGKVVATAFTSLATAAWTATDTAEIRVIAQGNRIRVWVDRKLYIDTTDATHNTETEAGLFGFNTANLSTFEDFYGQGL